MKRDCNWDRGGQGPQQSGQSHIYCLRLTDFSSKRVNSCTHTDPRTPLCRLSRNLIEAQRKAFSTHSQWLLEKCSQNLIMISLSDPIRDSYVVLAHSLNVWMWPTTEGFPQWWCCWNLARTHTRTFYMALP